VRDDWDDLLDIYSQEGEDVVDIGICGGCGAYGKVGESHIRDGEECGQFA
jgi:hypothetical protein